MPATPNYITQWALPTVIFSAIAALSAIAQSASPLPDATAFAECVLRVARTYPADGKHTYHWPKQGAWKGVTQDVFYNGELICTGDAQRRCHCSGITWEVFMRAIDEYNRDRADKALHTWTPKDVKNFQFLWFGSDGNKHCLENAVLTYGIGNKIADPADARPGDFVQFWRGNGSGHSCIFQEWVRDGNGRITHLKYWSAQKKTNGIGFNQETVGDERGIILDQVYIVRVGKPSGHDRAKDIE
ncbi:MAG: hypothetical protein SGI88_21880 [Candidatus Hydrogenedentes bacterium]|nr:hypothetical protein [Candidatus Hydrogenedentota bacterium]